MSFFLIDKIDGSLYVTKKYISSTLLEKTTRLALQNQSAGPD
jgi:hypothetical protein